MTRPIMHSLLLCAMLAACAAPVIADLPIAGREVAASAAPGRAALDAHMARFGRGRFAVTGARYAVPDPLAWQPLVSRVVTDPHVQRGATRLVMPSDAPHDWLVEVWRTRGRDGLAVAILDPGGLQSPRLLGYYALRFEVGFVAEERDPRMP